MRSFVFPLFQVVFVLMLGGCWSNKHSESGYQERSQGAHYKQRTEIDFDDMEVAGAMASPESLLMDRKASGGIGSSGRGSGGGGGGYGMAVGGANSVAPPVPTSSTLAEPDNPESPARMVHYEGWTVLRVAKPDESADALAALAEEFGGHVEKLSFSHVTLRVPVDRFEEAFERVLEMGDVLDRLVSAEDVTEAFVSTGLRRRTAEATRDRLIVLLAKSKDEKEKLALVREIQRLTEELDSLEARMRMLGDLASLSRITVELLERDSLSYGNTDGETAEFAWIRSLTPFHAEICSEGDKLPLEVPDGMVDLEQRGHFVAEGADGARVWSVELENNPEGDTHFWMSAISERLGADFASAEVREVAGWQQIRLVDRSDDPYIWLISVRVEGRSLFLVEAYLPSAEHEERYGAAIDQALQGRSS